MRVSFSKNSQSITAFTLYRSGLAKSFGSLLETYEEWNFGSTSVLLGLHGHVENKIIRSLGFITHEKDNTKCPIEEEVLIEIDTIDQTVEDSSTIEEEESEPEPEVLDQIPETCFISSTSKVGR